MGAHYIERGGPPIPFTWRKEKLRLAAVMISGLASTLGVLNLAPPTTAQAAATHTDGIGWRCRNWLALPGISAGEAAGNSRLVRGPSGEPASLYSRKSTSGQACRL